MTTPINRVYNVLGKAGLAPFPYVPRSIRYGLRTALIEVLIDKSVRLPPLRTDVGEYEGLFADAVPRFREVMAAHSSQVRWPLGRVFNGLFECVDAYLYHAVLRSARPRRVVEVGSGNSAWIARDALRLNGMGELVVIDPSPRMHLPSEATWHHAKVEDVDVDLFRGLAANDVLFIDSSHRIEEVAYHRDHILPILAPGVLVHVHDFYFPYDSGYRSDSRRFEETDAWLQEIRSPSSAFRVLTCAPFVRYAQPGLLEALVPPYARTPDRVPGSLWLRKV